MTVRELISLNSMITDVCIEVRKGGGEIEDCLNYGMDYGVEPPYPMIMHQMTSRQKKATYIRKSINAYDDGKDYWQIKTERIPSKWLDLEVFSWMYTSVYVPHHHRDDITRSMQGIRIVALPSGETLEVKPKEKVDGWEHLDGQMSIFDMEGNND